MTKNLVHVFPDDPLEKVEGIFKSHSFHHLPVINLDGTIAGIISKQDWWSSHRLLAMETSGKIWSEKKAASITAGDIMTAYPMFLTPSDSVSAAADIFLENKFHALPVVEDGQLLGMVTSFDILKFAFYDQGIPEK